MFWLEKKKVKIEKQLLNNVLFNRKWMPNYHPSDSNHSKPNLIYIYSSTLYDCIFMLHIFNNICQTPFVCEFLYIQFSFEQTAK